MSSYMAPELIRGEKVCDRADVWSLAVTCVEMLTKQMPYEQYSNNLTVTYKIGSLNLHPNVPATAPSALQDLLSACFTTDPDARPTALVARHQLEDILADHDHPPSPSKTDASIRHFHTATRRSGSPRLARHKSLPARRKMRLRNDSGGPTAVQRSSRGGKQQSTSDGVVWDQLITPHADVIRHKALRLDALRAELQTREGRLDEREARLERREQALEDRLQTLGLDSAWDVEVNGHALGQIVGSEGLTSFV
jgi:serine/threonine protein kinase